MALFQNREFLKLYSYFTYVIMNNVGWLFSKKKVNNFEVFTILNKFEKWNSAGIELRDYGRLRKDAELKVQSHAEQSKIKFKWPKWTAFESLVKIRSSDKDVTEE